MTPNHGYETPTEGTLDWHVPLNGNFETVDTDVEIRDLEAALDQYTPKDGAKFLATDTGVRYLGDGTAWTELPPHQADRVVAPTRTVDPADPLPGSVWYREDIDELRLQTATGPVAIQSSTNLDSQSAEPIVRMDFDDPAPEAMKGTRYTANGGVRDAEQLETELYNRGWTDSNYHVINNLFYNSQNTVSGNHSLEFCFPKDERMGFDLKTTVDREEAWAQFYVKFEDGFNPFDADFKGGVKWGHGGKLPGFTWSDSSSGCAGGGNWYDGCPGWSARGMFWDPKTAGYAPHVETGKILLSHYVYHQNQGGQYGDTQYWTQNDAGLVDSGQWYEITHHVKMNDAGSKNGVIEAWVDGTKAYESTDWELRGTKDPAINIGGWWHVAYFGGGWYSPKDQSLYTDDLRIYDENPL